LSLAKPRVLFWLEESSVLRATMYGSEKEFRLCSDGDTMGREPIKCEWVGLRDALRVFVLNEAGHQGSKHIKPLHWYVACRLVIEGGFRPEDIVPRPPFVVDSRNSRHVLRHDANEGGSGERTVLGGLKTKDVDVVVTKNGIGPVMAVSLKGTLKAFRNLTNRMEEAVGDCTNLHIAYPALVYGFLQVMRANREGPQVVANDVALSLDGQVIEHIRRYHDVLARLSDRDDVRDDTTKYEAIALALVDPDPPSEGIILPFFPEPGSPLLLGEFFQKLYMQYDQRFIYAAPALKTTTRRFAWDPESPVLGDPRLADYSPRLAHED